MDRPGLTGEKGHPMTWNEKYSRLQRAVLVVLALYVVGFGILTAVFRARPGISYQEGLLQQVETGGDRETFRGRAEGRDVTLVRTREASGTVALELTVKDTYTGSGRVEPDPASTPPNQMGEGVAVFWNDRELFRGGWHDSGSFPMLFTPEGELDSRSVSVTVVADGQAPDPWEGYAPGAATVLSLAYDQPQLHRGSLMLYAAMVFLTVLLAVNVAFPKALFQLRYMFSVRDPEPTEFYLGMQKLSWVLLTVLLAVGYIIALTMIE